MGFRSTNVDLNDLATPLEKVSTFEENFDASVGLMIDEESSFSRYLGNENKRKRDAEIRGLIEDGKIPKTLMYTNSTAADRGFEVNYDNIAQYLNTTEDYQSEPIKTDIELKKERDDLLGQRRAYRNDIFRRAGAEGTAGLFAGSFVAGSIDPVNVAATILTPVTAGARGVSRALYTLSQTKRGAMYGAAAAGAVEPFIHSWKEEIGVEYTLTDSMINMAASGAFDGTINGVAAFISFKRVKGDTPDENASIQTEEIQTETKAKTKEVKPAKKLTLYEQHLAKVEAKNKKLAEKQEAEDFNRPMRYEEREEMKVGLMNQGLDAEEAEDLAQFVYESTQFPDQTKSAKEVFEELETTQQRMEVGKPKEDNEPSFGTADKDLVEEMYEDINPELKAQFDEAELGIDAEIERLNSKLECLNG